MDAIRWVLKKVKEEDKEGEKDEGKNENKEDNGDVDKPANEDGDPSVGCLVCTEGGPLALHGSDSKSCSLDLQDSSSSGTPDIDQFDNENATPLHVAIFNGIVELTAWEQIIF